MCVYVCMSVCVCVYVNRGLYFVRSEKNFEAVTFYAESWTMSRHQPGEQRESGRYASNNVLGDQSTECDSEIWVLIDSSVWKTSWNTERDWNSVGKQNTLCINSPGLVQFMEYFMSWMKVLEPDNLELDFFSLILPNRKVKMQHGVELPKEWFNLKRKRKKN